MFLTLTAINFVHVNGRSLYINWCMVVVVGGNILHHVKKEAELSGRGKCPGEYVRGGMSRRGMSGSRKNNASSARYQTFIFGRIVHVRLNVQLIGFGCGLILSVRSNGWMCIV